MYAEVTTAPPAPKQSVRSKIVSTKNFVKKHRVAIAVTTTSAVFVTLNLRNAKILDAFLAEHNLLDAYYNVQEVAETTVDNVTALTV